MILGIILPAALAIFALVDIVAFRMIRAHSEGGGVMAPKAYMIWGAAAIALPVIAYVVLNFLMPSWGATKVF